MSNDIQQLRETLLSVDVLNPVRAHERINQALQELERIESARARDAELIQMAVDLAYDRAFTWMDTKFRDVLCKDELAFLAAAEVQGFKPTQE